MVGTRVFSRLLHKLAQNFDTHNPARGNSRGNTQTRNTCAAAEFKHLVAVLCRYRGRQHDGIGSGAEPVAGLACRNPSA